MKIEDTFIEENNGVFRISGCAGEFISEVTRVDVELPNLHVWEMGDFTIEIFKQAFPKVFLNEVV